MSEDLGAIAKHVAGYGWTVMRVSADGPGPDFAYSIGMVQTLAHPEILIVGLALDMAQQLINDAGAAVRRGDRFVAGSVSDALLEGYSVTFRRVPEYQYGAYLGWGRRFYRQDAFPVLQMIYPDREGRWPWQDGVSLQFRAAQPVLADQPEPPWARDARVEPREIDGVIKQVVDRVLDRAGQQLAAEIDREQLRVGGDGLVASHRRRGEGHAQRSTAPSLSHTRRALPPSPMI